MNAMATAPTPTPADALRGLVAWLKIHPKTRYALIFFAVCTICYFINVSSAAATATETDSQALDLPLVGITDTHGVPIWRYMELPMDPGNTAAHVMRSIRYMFASIVWAIYALPVLMIIAMAEWIVSFEWLSWIAAPFEFVAGGVTGVLEAWMLIPLATAISALWIGIGYVRGRTGAATVEFVMVVLVFGFIASPFADPFTWMAGDGSDTASESGFIQQAGNAGAEAGGMTINQETDPENATVSGAIVDITLRQPLLNMSFGSSLSGDCEEVWNEHASGGSDVEAEDLRKEVVDCSDAAKAANETDSFLWMFDYIMAWPVMLGVCFLLAVFLFFLIWQVASAFISAFMAVVRGFLALFPGNSRVAWLNSLFQVIVSGVLIGIYIFALTVYMWALGQVLDAVPAPLARVGALLVGLLAIIGGFLYWKIKKSGQSVGQRLAKALGKNGLSKDAPDKQPSNFGTTAKNLTKTAVSKGIDRRNNARMLRTGLTAATAMSTGGLGTAAAKVGSGLAAKATTARAMTAVSKNAQRNGTPHGSASPQSAAPPRGNMGASVPTASRSAPTEAAASTITTPPEPTAAQSAGMVPPPAGAEDAPQSPLPAPAGQGTTGVASRVAAHRAADSGAQGQSQRAGRAAGVPVPAAAAARTPQQGQEGGPRLRNIPPGRHGRNYVHKNGQVHQPLTVEPDGTPVRNVPSEEKIARATQSADGWILPGAKNLKPSSRTHATSQPTAPTRSPERENKQTEQRPAPKPMQQRRTNDAEPAKRRPRPELVDVAARASQASQSSTEAPKQPTERPTPRPMQNRRANRERGGENK